MACKTKIRWVSLQTQAWTGLSYLCDLGALKRLDELLKFSDLGHRLLRDDKATISSAENAEKSRENNTLSPNISFSPPSSGRVWAMCGVT